MDARWLVGLGLAVALTACGHSPLVGSWSAVDPASKTAMTYTFNADGTGRMTLEIPADVRAKMGALAPAADQPVPFAWTLEADKLTISPAADSVAAKTLIGGTKLDFRGLKIEGDTLTASMGSVTMTLKRQA